MDKNKFLNRLKEVLECENEISFDSVLDDIDECDSIGMMSTSVFLEEEYGYKTTVNGLLSFLTVEELYNAVSKK